MSRRNKYGNKRTTIDGIAFASKAEARRYQELKLMEAAGEIWGLILQPSFTIKYDETRICRVVLDFQYFDLDHKEHNEDVKGRDNALSRLKRKLLKAFYGIDVELVK